MTQQTTHPRRSIAARDANRAAIIATYRTMGPDEQAAMLKLSKAYVLKMRSIANQDGALDPATRTNRPAWSIAQVETTVRMLKSGASLTQVAHKIGRTETAIIQYLESKGMTVDEVRTRGKVAVRSLLQVAALLGVNHSRVAAWRKEGLLQANTNGTWKHRKRKITQRTFSEYLVTDAQLRAFLADRAAWPEYDPASITDTRWREIAEQIRRGAGGRWITARDYALARHYGPTYGNYLVRTNQVAAPTMKRGHTWYVWEAYL